MTNTTLTHIEQLVDDLPLEDQLLLLEHLAQRLRQVAQQRPPQDLHGIWRDRFPADFDLDAALSEIRHAWEHEWSQGFKL